MIGLFHGMFNGAASVAETALAARVAPLFPEEQAAMSRAMKRRQREFVAGRTCARRAMSSLGIASQPIPVGADRAPVWPQGMAGSISHSKTRCAAVVGRHSDGIFALGIDVEEATPLDVYLSEEICSPAERLWLETQPADQRGLLLTAFFSAKECTYKCQYSMSHTFFGFHAIRVEFDLAEERFYSIFETDIPPFRLRDRLDGRLAFREGYIVSSMTIGK
ncbi:4'-phosphopantetheinyl transferase superfamily protein [Rhizobium sp. NTR19]|uniref:Enterobactin synthase component D n=1 Tax=Neorhizobium turbinariae TaxID=2937795 RepID=A0ABT0IXI5_9HYPH|nr:4'-phosphopantetheinyl transferase superfamily protein [Neorhizobium turbinariae]MCK8782446.1 4'-phosphopantetheinyl transferase superfamily protein [Neorhizobium turbinariae]